MATDDTTETDDGATRRARVRTEHAEPALVAAAVGADNTDEMTTRVAEGAVVTTIERPTTGGLRSTLDDYVVNLTVADRSARIAADHDASANRTTNDTADDNTETTDT